MKRPQPDFGEIAIANYLQNLGFINKFIKLWGTTTVNGEEVLVDKRYFYKSMDENMRKLTKWLKIYDDLTGQKMKGIKSAWLYLNPAKDGAMDINDIVLAENLEDAIGDGLLIDVYLQPKPNNFNRHNISFTYPDITASVSDQPAIIQEIKNEFAGYYYAGYMTETSSANRYKDAVAKYALITDSIDYEVRRVSKVTDYVSTPIGYASGNDTSTYSNLVYTVTPVKAYKITLYINKTNLTNTSTIVTTILEDLAKTTNDNLVDGNLVALKRSLGSVEIDEDEVGYSDPRSYSALSTAWVQHEGRYYLKTSFLRDNSILAKDRVQYLMSLIDSDYKKKPRSAWERFVAMVIVVAAIVFAAPTGGASLTLVSAATFVLTVAFYITVATVVMQKLGYDGIALSLNDFLKAAAPFIKIASIMAAIGALQNVYLAGKQSLVDAGAQASQVGITDAMIEGVKMQFENLLTSASTDLSFEQTVKGLDFVFNAYAEQDKKDLQKKIKREEAKIAEYEEAMEQNKTSHMLLDVMRSSYNPLTRDYSVYDSMYDKPYEWWATQYHTGCMQANGVSAFWTKDREYFPAGFAGLDVV